jgi:short-subunit dehydrogenase
VTIASIYGLVAFGRFTAYNVSKFGLVGLSESLRAEYGRQGIGVSTICPGFVSTNLFTSASSGYVDGRKPTPPQLLCTTPECVADKVVSAIYRDRRLTLITPMAHFLYHLNRFAPGLIDFLNRLGRRRRMAKNAARQAQETELPLAAPGNQPDHDVKKAA